MSMSWTDTVPNLTLGLPVVERLVQVSPVPIDAHLMIEDPDRWAPVYAELGAKSVTFPTEVWARSGCSLSARCGPWVRASMALKPGDAVGALRGVAARP